MADYSEETNLTITKTLDKYIGLVLDVGSNVDGGCFFYCYGEWVSLSQCEKLCPRYSWCDKVGQVMTVGSEDYKDGLFEETKEV